jgi:hypothetical protein
LQDQPQVGFVSWVSVSERELQAERKGAIRLRRDHARCRAGRDL